MTSSPPMARAKFHPAELLTQGYGCRAAVSIAIAAPNRHGDNRGGNLFTLTQCNRGPWVRI
jgi:hypothetical protein